MNNTPESQTVGATPKVVANRTIALYDPQDGRIVHMHQVLTLEGARQLDPQQYEREARKHAQRLGHPVQPLHALHIPDFRPSARALRVDLEKKVLIDAPAQGRKV